MALLYSTRLAIYTVSQKTSHLWLAITLTIVNGIWYFFGRNVTNKASKNKRRFTMPPQITRASVLPGKTRNTKIALFTLAVLVHYQNSSSRCLISSVFLIHDSYSCCFMTSWIL